MKDSFHEQTVHTKVSQFTEADHSDNEGNKIWVSCGAIKSPISWSL